MILIFGPPGSGKGTQAELLQSKGLVKWFSTGHLLREKLSEGEEFTKMAKGDLVDDEFISRVLKEALNGVSEEDRPILLDGYPRSLGQVDWLYSKDDPRHVIGVIELVGPQDKLEERLLLRAEREGRADDNLETIKHRFEVYNQQSKPVIDRFRAEGMKVVQVDSDKSIEEIHIECQKALAEIINSDN